MGLLVESINYGAINTIDTNTHVFYVIMLTSEAYTIQDNTEIDEKSITAGKFVVKEQYVCSTPVDTNCYLESTSPTSHHHSDKTQNNSYMN